MSLESCTGAHGASKSSRDQKNEDNSPRKGPEMLEIMSFDDAPRVVYWGVTGHQNPPRTRNRGLSHENGQKCSLGESEKSRFRLWLRQANDDLKASLNDEQVASIDTDGRGPRLSVALRKLSAGTPALQQRIASAFLSTR